MDEQHGKKRADYGKQQLHGLALHLRKEFGKGFDERNLRNIRAFYQAYSIWNAVRTELSWTHYRILCSQKSEAVAKYSVLTDSQQIFASKYLHFLPTEEELRTELERERTALCAN